jgi:hypothetical protein
MVLHATKHSAPAFPAFLAFLALPPVLPFPYFLYSW